MPDLTFDLRSTNTYVQSFAALRTALATRDKGRVLEVETVFPADTLTVYMEAESLYLIGFGNAHGQILSLDGDGQPFEKYLGARFDKKNVYDSGIKAKYTGETWKLQLVKETINQIPLLKSFAPGDTRITESKKHIDRLAFVMAESARFMPIRCAVACILHDDTKFLAVLESLAGYSKNLVLGERKVQKIEPGVTLSSRDAHLRDVDPTSNLHVFEMKGNSFDGLSKTDRWFDLLSKSDGNLTKKERQRLNSLPMSHYYSMTLGDFRTLVTNWSKLSASPDPYIHEIMQEVHVHNGVGATPEDSTKFMIEWR